MATKKVARHAAEFTAVSAELKEVVHELLFAWDGRRENPEGFLDTLIRLGNARLALDDVTSRAFGGAS